EFIDLLLSLAAAVWRRFPLPVIITGASIVVLLLLIAMLSRRRSARDEFDLGAGRADQRREPDLFGGYSPYSDDYRPEARRARGREAGRRKRFGFLALSLAFLFGALVGFAGLGTAKRYDIAPAVVKAVDRVETKIATFYAPPAPPSTEA